jgi:hypothetical protein
MKSTMRLTLEHIESFTGFNTGANFDFGSEAEVGTCAGLGVMVCTNIIETTVKGGVSLAGGSEFTTAFNENQNTASYTTMWSYTTSVDPWSAGTSSDVFLVPSLNVKFKDITEIMWDATRCAYTEQKLKFALDSPENKPAITFLTHHMVTTTEIPNLERLRDAAQANVSAAKTTSGGQCPNMLPSSPSAVSLLSDECKIALANRDAMSSSILNWNSFLERHDNVMELARQGKLQGTPYSWVTSIKDKSDVSKRMAHYSGLVPNTLAENAISLQTGKKTENSTELKQINLIKFSCGGSQFMFELHQNEIKSHTEKLNGAQPIQNSNGYLNVGGYYNLDVKAPALVGVELTGDITHHVNQVATQTDDTSEDTMIGFVLSDDDDTDVFDVSVYLDPDYGTFVFVTTSGQSRCPHEDGTVPLEEPAVQLISGPTSPVLPDEPLIFRLQLANNGFVPAGFHLYTSAPTDLTTSFTSYYESIQPKQAVNTTIVVTRGVVDYAYDGIQFYIGSSCEYEGGGPDYASVALFNDIAQQRIRFVEPCPGILWAGTLARERSFKVNLASQNNDAIRSFSFPIRIRNPMASYRSYADMINGFQTTSRLESVGLYFRRVGSIDWSQGRYLPSPTSTSSQIINFALLTEDSFGYISVDWDVSNLADGEYEIEANTICSASSGSISDEYDVSNTERISGMIDRRSPRLFGLPLPSPENLLFPGDIVTFHLDEEIDCTKPHSFLVTAQVNGRGYRPSFGNNIKNNMDIECEGRSIIIALQNIRTSAMIGGTYLLSISNVVDLNGNVMQSPIVTQYRFANWNITQLSTSFGTVTTFNKPNGSNRRRLVYNQSYEADNEESKNDLGEYLAGILNISMDRIAVELSCVKETCGMGNDDDPEENLYQVVLQYQVLVQEVVLSSCCSYCVTKAE